MKILITNIVALNGGDAAIMYGMIQSLRETFGQNINIHIYSSAPNTCKQIYPEFKFRETIGLIANNAPFGKIRYIGSIMRKLQRKRYLITSLLYGKNYKLIKYILPKDSQKSIEDYATADIIISSGGTYLTEAYGLITQYTDYSICHNLNKKVFFYTQSLGPFTQSWSKEWMRKVFSASPCIMVRDERSYNNIKDLDIKPRPKIIKVADAAFSLADKKDLNTAIKKKLPKNLKIAISVREWSIFKNRSKEEGIKAYRESIAALVKYFIENEHQVTFFSTCQGLSEYTDDSQEAQAIIDLLPSLIAKNVTIQKEYIHFRQVMKQLRETDILIGTRLHMSILSLIVGTPVFPIAYEFKTKELFSNLGLEKYVVSIDNISPDNILSRYINFISEIDSQRESLFTQIELLSHNAKFASNYIKMF